MAGRADGPSADFRLIPASLIPRKSNPVDS